MIGFSVEVSYDDWYESAREARALACFLILSNFFFFFFF